MTITTSGRGKAVNKAQPVLSVMPAGAKTMKDTIVVSRVPPETKLDGYITSGGT